MNEHLLTIYTLKIVCQLKICKFLTTVVRLINAVIGPKRVRLRRTGVQTALDENLLLIENNYQEMS